MLINRLKDKLHSQIPLTKLMKMNIKEYTKTLLITTIPLNININDKGTAFAGSLSTITTISAWSVCWLITQELGFENANIVIIKNETNFFKPVKKDICCYTQKPSKEEITQLQEKLLKKRSGSIFIKSSVIEDKNRCVEFDGLYVIKLI